MDFIEHSSTANYYTTNLDTEFAVFKIFCIQVLFGILNFLILMVFTRTRFWKLIGSKRNPSILKKNCNLSVCSKNTVISDATEWNFGASLAQPCWKNHKRIVYCNLTFSGSINLTQKSVNTGILKTNLKYIFLWQSSAQTYKNSN